MKFMNSENAAPGAGMGVSVPVSAVPGQCEPGGTLGHEAAPALPVPGISPGSVASSCPPEGACGIHQRGIYVSERVMAKCPETGLARNRELVTHRSSGSR